MRAVVVLIGERPGLSAADSLGIYLTWAPRPGRVDAERNCVSNVRPPHGLGYAQAARTVAALLEGARALGASGVALKDEGPALGRLRSSGAGHGEVGQPARPPGATRRTACPRANTATPPGGKPAVEVPPGRRAALAVVQDAREHTDRRVVADDGHDPAVGRALLEHGEQRLDRVLVDPLVGDRRRGLGQLRGGPLPRLGRATGGGDDDPVGPEVGLPQPAPERARPARAPSVGQRPVGVDRPRGRPGRGASGGVGAASAECCKRAADRDVSGGGAGGRGGGCGRRRAPRASAVPARVLDQRCVPLVQPGPDVVGRVGPALPLVAREHRTGRGDTGEAGQSEELPEAHDP